MLVCFVEVNGDRRDLPRLVRRQRQMVIRDRSVTIVTEGLERPIPTQPNMLIPPSPTAEATSANSPGLSVSQQEL